MDLPTVSVIVPVRNEEKFIEGCINSILRSDYPEDKLEIIVVDGMSEDKTRDTVRDLMKKDSRITLLENPKKYTPHALNMGIDASKGEVFMVAGAHTSYSENYISECVSRLMDGCDVAGGVVEVLPSSDTLLAKAIAGVLRHPFGVGGARYRTSRNLERDLEVDTVAYGLYRKSLVKSVGKFNENLIRNQDIEYNLRIRRSGGKIVLVPSAKAFYRARDNLRDLWKNNFSNGFWVVWSTRYAEMPFSFRHLVPMFFVLFTVLGAVLSVFFKPFLYFYVGVMGLYSLLLILSSVQIAVSEKDIRLFFLAIPAFLTLHLSYGIGSVWALFKLVLARFSRLC